MTLKRVEHTAFSKLNKKQNQIHQVETFQNNDFLTKIIHQIKNIETLKVSAFVFIYMRIALRLHIYYFFPLVCEPCRQVLF